MSGRLILTAEELWEDALVEIGQRTGTPEIQINSLPKLSHNLFGLKRKEFIVLAGRPSNGKSSVVLQMAYDVAKQGFNVYFITREMTELSLIERLFCNLAMVKNEDMKYRPWDFKDKFSQFKELVSGIKFVITDSIGVDIENLYEAIEDLPQADMIVLDYIQAVRGGKGMMKRREVLDDYIFKFKELCHEKNMVGVMVSQINRGSEGYENKRPQLWQLKETGCLEEAADVALLVFWENYYDKSKDVNKYEINIAKQRNGTTGVIDFKYYPWYYRIEEVFNNPELTKAQETFGGTFVERSME